MNPEEFHSEVITRLVAVAVCLDSQRKVFPEYEPVLGKVNEVLEMVNEIDY